MRRLFRKKSKDTAFNNSQLSLYAGILESDFVHYGYFDDPGVEPASLSLEQIRKAQERYSERIIDLLNTNDAPVLDVGAGMGGISRMMMGKGVQPVALTPDRTQIAFLRERHPNLEIIEGRFQSVDWTPHYGRFGTILNAESLQYITLDHAFDLVPRLLRAGGSWLICDYFRVNQSIENSGHRWDQFRDRALADGWSFRHEEDITDHVLPGLGFVHLLGLRFVRPLFDYLDARLERSHPAARYALEDVIVRQDARLEESFISVNPDAFAKQKRYMLVALTR